MSATVPRRTRPPGDLAQTGVVALLLAVAAMTWALTHRRMAGMDAGPGSDLGGPGHEIGRRTARDGSRFRTQAVTKPRRLNVPAPE